MNVSQSLTIAIDVVHNDKKFVFVLPYGISYQEAVEAFNEIGKALVAMAEQSKKDSARENSENAVQEGAL